MFTNRLLCLNFSKKEYEMKSKKLLVSMVSLLLLSLMLVACGSTEESSFPTGQFMKVGATNHGLILNEDGTFSVFDGSATIVSGTYRVEGDTYIETSNDENCPAPMSFKYMFDGTNLTFNYVSNPADDPCGGRKSDFNNVAYILVK